MKRSFSCPSPTTPLESESPLRSTPTHRFKVPRYPSRSRRTPKQCKPRPQRSHPYQHLDQDYPGLPVSNTHSSPLSPVSPCTSLSYAQATQPRTGKRSTSERISLSPIECLPKRSALAGLQSTPTEPLVNSHLDGTPKDEVMEISDSIEFTPGSER